MDSSELHNDVRQRRQMVQKQLRQRGIADEKVLAVMERLPRQHFIPAANRFEAYYDQPVSIGLGQTISQPYIVALMTEKLQLEPSHRVLEIGTGCGYQTAILAQLSRRVYTVERLETLARQARQNLEALNITNVEYHIGDGTQGWPPRPDDGPTEYLKNSTEVAELARPGPKTDDAPEILTPVEFDRIMVAAAPESIPPALLDQLVIGGKMVIPVGATHDQRLLLVEKIRDKKRGLTTKESLLCYCRFVRLISGAD